MPDRRARRKFGQAHIDVVTSDGHYRHLTPLALDIMLEKNQIKQFKRSSGWVTVGVDPIRVRDRREGDGSFDGPDRRSYF